MVGVSTKTRGDNAMHNRELKNLVGTKGFIRVEVTRWNPSGQVEIKPLCSNCDGKVAWVKPEDIIQACDEKIEVPETWNSLSKKPAENEKYCLKADTKKMLTAGREETLEMLKKKLGFKKNEFVILFVGRLAEEKNVEFNIEIYKWGTDECIYSSKKMNFTIWYYFNFFKKNKFEVRSQQCLP